MGFRSLPATKPNHRCRMLCAVCPRLSMADEHLHPHSSHKTFSHASTFTCCFTSPGSRTAFTPTGHPQGIHSHSFSRHPMLWSSFFTSHQLRGPQALSSGLQLISHARLISHAHNTHTIRTQWQSDPARPSKLTQNSQNHKSPRSCRFTFCHAFRKTPR